MTTSLDKLIERARSKPQTAQARESQRISFVYGNTNLENPDITRETVVEEAKKLSKRS